MSSKLIVAGAGSGKTTWLVNEALKISKEKVLITTFTDANERSIREKFFKSHGCIPANVTIMTWFAFLLQHGVRPYQSVIYDGSIKGMLLVNSRSGFRFMSAKGPVYYGEKDAEPYYLSKSKKIYSDKIAKFVYKANKQTKGLVIDRMCRIYPNFFIDEVQDMAGYDLELINLLHKAGINLLMVGDPRQVTYHTHDEAMNKKYINGDTAKYLRDKCKTASIDETTLCVSHRNHPSICRFANTVYPNYPPLTSYERPRTGHDGIFLVAPSDVSRYIAEYRPMQLRDKRNVVVNENAPAMNFGDAKGLTFDRVLIYPTKPILAWIKDPNSKIEDRSRARLYVAITRAKYSVAFVDGTIAAESLPLIERWG